jgi:CrcB protein
MNWILVAIGGATGAVARYGVGVQAGRWLGPGLPYGTLIANVAGGLLMGVLVGWLAHRGGADQERWRLLLGVGVLGGFTTFSAFSLETASMIQRRDLGLAAAYVALSVVLSVGALFAGLFFARRMFA